MKNPYQRSRGKSGSTIPRQYLAGGAVVLFVLLVSVIRSLSSSSSSSPTSESPITSTKTSGDNILNNENSQFKVDEHGKLRTVDAGSKKETNPENNNDPIVDITKEQEKTINQADTTTAQQKKEEAKHEISSNGKNANPNVVVPAENDPMDELRFKPTMYFHHYNKGKSGAVIRDMLMAHAYAFHMNGHYGGACCEDDVNVERHERLLDAIGLKEALPFACPHDYHEDPPVPKLTVPKLDYQTDGTRTWTPAYVNYLKSLVQYPPKNDENEYVIVVHIRRGEVTPCRDKNGGYDRYLPNLHYMNVIDKYIKPGAIVKIISESESFEPLDEFRQKGYDVSTDNNLEEIWRSFISADVIILSRSDFSMVPAVCARGKVVYTPFWHKPVTGWERVPKDLMKETDMETQRLQAERCF